MSILIALFLVESILANQSPLEPVDTSSPRATYTTFIENMHKIKDALDSNAPRNLFEDPVERVVMCIDLSQIAPVERAEAGRVSAMILIEIFGRIPPVNPQAIPEDVTSWSVPGTDIKIELISEGDRTGEYLFSARTVARLDDFYSKASKLPYQEGAWEGPYQTYLNVPGRFLPTKWADDIPFWLLTPVIGIPLWKFCSLILAISLLSVGFYLSFIATRKIAGIPGKSIIRRQIGSIAMAVLAITILWMFRFIIIEIIGIRGTLQELLSLISILISDIFQILGTLVSINLLFSIITSSKYFKKREINGHFLKVVVRLSSLVVATIMVIRVADSLGLQIMPILAGFGIGGIAIALAARQTVENVIGGLTLFADKPVKVGDFCKFGEESGTIEEIGLRSTRIRKLDDTLVSVPNAQFSQLDLENWSQRRKFLYQTVLQFRYETKHDQMIYLLVTLREMLLSHPKVVQDKMRVRFIEFGAHSLDVEVFVYSRAVDYPDSLAVREDLNLRIMDVVTSSGAEFAFPSTTAYIAQDGERDEESIKRAEENVALWKSDGRLPFPNHSRDTIRALKGTLDYPPEGSVESKPKPMGEKS